MAIITKNPHQWFVVTDPKSGKSQTLYNDETPGHNYPFGFESNFSDASTPAVNTITAYNMSQEHKNFYQKGFKAQLYFNWGSSKKLLSEGYISKIDAPQHDGTTDTQVIYFTEGTDYNNLTARKMRISKKKSVNKYKHVKVQEKGKWKNKAIKHTVTEVYKSGKHKGQTHTVHHYTHTKVWQKGKTKTKRIKTRATKTVQANRVFKKGTSIKKIIQGVAAQTKIKISKIDLAKNPNVKRAFTAKGKPLTVLKQLVAQTGSKLEYIGGKLEIVNPKSTKRTWYVIDDQDLITPPAKTEADDSNGVTTYEITTPLVPEITVNVGIIMKSKYLKGRFYVKSGKHSSDGQNPQTQCSLVAL